MQNWINLDKTVRGNLVCRIGKVGLVFLDADSQVAGHGCGTGRLASGPGPGPGLLCYGLGAAPAKRYVLYRLFPLGLLVFPSFHPTDAEPRRAVSSSRAAAAEYICLRRARLLPQDHIHIRIDARYIATHLPPPSARVQMCVDSRSLMTECDRPQ